MTQTLAYQIGAVFLLAALMIAGTMTRGLFPVGMFKNVGLTLGIVTVIVGGYAACRALPEMSSWVHFGSDVSTAQPAQAQPPKAPVNRNVVARPVTAAPAVVFRDVETPIAPVVETTATQTGSRSPVVIRNRATEPDPEGKGKKVLNSVGRFLHIVHKKDQPQTP